MAEQLSGYRVGGMTLRQAALVAGIAYVLNPVSFAEWYVMPRLVTDDAARTVFTIQGHQHLFAAAVLAYFFSLMGDVVIAWALYVLLAPVNRALSLLASWLQLIYAAMSLAAVANLALVYRLLFVTEYSKLNWEGTLPAQVRILVGSFRSGWTLGLVLFGMHLVVTGWLFARSSYLPRWLGWMLIADGAAWMLDQLSLYVAPNATLGFLNVFYVGELVLMVWLVGWGWRIREPEAVLA